MSCLDWNCHRCWVWELSRWQITGWGICTSRTKKSPLVETTGFTGSYRNLLDYLCRHCTPFLLCFRMCENSQPVSSSHKPVLSTYIYVYRYIQFRMSIWWKLCNWSISFKISWPSVEQSMKRETSWNMTDEINAPKQNHFQFWRHSKVRPGHGLCNLRPIAPVGCPEARDSQGIGGHGMRRQANGIPWIPAKQQV